MSSSPTVLLTGATGHLGAAIFAALSADPGGCDLRMLIRSEEKLHQLAASDDRLAGLKDAEWVIGDIRDADVLSKALDGVDVVVHACHSHEYWRGAEHLYGVNVGGTYALGAALAGACCVKKVIYIGSYSAHRILPDASTVKPLRGVSARESSSISKPLAQRVLWDAASDNGFSLHIVSPGYMVGPYQLNPTYFGVLFHALQFGSLRWCPPNIINIVDVRDVAEAVVDCLKNGDAPTWNLATGDNTSMMRLFSEMNRQAGFSQMPRTIPVGLLRFVPRLKQFGKYGQRYFAQDHASSSASDLNRRSYDLGASVRDSIIWAQRHPMFASRSELLLWLAKRYLR